MPDHLNLFLARYVEFGKVLLLDGATDFRTLSWSDDAIRDISGPRASERFMDWLEFPDHSPFNQRDGALSAALIDFQQGAYLFIQIQHRREGELSRDLSLTPRTNRLYNQVRFTYLERGELPIKFAEGLAFWEGLLYDNRRDNRDNLSEQPGERPLVNTAYALKDYRRDSQKAAQIPIPDDRWKPIREVPVGEAHVRAIVDALVNLPSSSQDAPSLLVHSHGLNWLEKLRLVQRVQYLVYPRLGAITFDLDFVTEQKVRLRVYDDPIPNLRRPSDKEIVLGEVYTFQDDYYATVKDLECRDLYHPTLQYCLRRPISSPEALAAYQLVEKPLELAAEERMAQVEQFYAIFDDALLKKALHPLIEPGTLDVHILPGQPDALVIRLLPILAARNFPVNNRERLVAYIAGHATALYQERKTTWQPVIQALTNAEQIRLAGLEGIPLEAGIELLLAQIQAQPKLLEPAQEELLAALQCCLPAMPDPDVNFPALLELLSPAKRWKALRTLQLSMHLLSILLVYLAAKGDRSESDDFSSHYARLAAEVYPYFRNTRNEAVIYDFMSGQELFEFLEQAADLPESIQQDLILRIAQKNKPLRQGGAKYLEWIRKFIGAPSMSGSNWQAILAYLTGDELVELALAVPLAERTAAILTDTAIISKKEIRQRAKLMEAIVRSQTELVEKTSRSKKWIEYVFLLLKPEEVKNLLECQDCQESFLVELLVLSHAKYQMKLTCFVPFYLAIPVERRSPAIRNLLIVAVSNSKVSDLASIPADQLEQIVIELVRARAGWRSSQRLLHTFQGSGSQPGPTILGALMQKALNEQDPGFWGDLYKLRDATKDEQLHGDIVAELKQQANPALTRYFLEQSAEQTSWGDYCALLHSLLIEPTASILAGQAEDFREVLVVGQCWKVDGQSQPANAQETLLCKIASPQFKSALITAVQSIAKENIPFAEWWFYNELVQDTSILIEQYRQICHLLEDKDQELASASPQFQFLINGGKHPKLSLCNACKHPETGILNEQLFIMLADEFTAQGIRLSSGDIHELVERIGQEQVNSILAKIVKSEIQKESVQGVTPETADLWLSKTEGKLRAPYLQNQADLLEKILLSLVGKEPVPPHAKPTQPMHQQTSSLAPEPDKGIGMEQQIPVLPNMGENIFSSRSGSQKHLKSSGVDSTTRRLSGDEIILIIVVALVVILIVATVVLLWNVL